MTYNLTIVCLLMCIFSVSQVTSTINCNGGSSLSLGPVDEGYAGNNLVYKLHVSKFQKFSDWLEGGASLKTCCWCF